MPFPQPLIDVAIYLTTGIAPVSIDQEKRKELEEIFLDFIQEKITFDEGCARIKAFGYDNQSMIKLKRILSLQPNLYSYDGNTKNKNNRCTQVRHRSAPWTIDEDEYLLAGIYRYGFSEWQKVSLFVGNGRTRSQCGQRWLRCLDPNMKRDKWTKEEDMKLFQLVQIHGAHAWSRIAKEIGNRTDVQCRYRFGRNQARLQFSPGFVNQKINILQIQQMLAKSNFNKTIQDNEGNKLRMKQFKQT